MIGTQTTPSLLLVGCGILQEEVRFLIKKNNWPVETFFIDSALHVDFGKLSQALNEALAQYVSRDVIVFYGCCHPQMEKILSSARTIRTVGQNCVEMLLGTEVFTRELEQGAFFLLEEWARRWEQIMGSVFGTNKEIMREILQGDRGYLLGITTPCSVDFKAEAEEAGRMAGLQVRWMDISLDHLESVLQDVIDKKTREIETRETICLR